jgi:hypothetical protein
MPPNPKNVKRTVELSQDYQDESATIDFYTNNAIAIGRDRDDPEEGVWLDNLEKRALYETLREELEDG